MGGGGGGRSLKGQFTPILERLLAVMTPGVAGYVFIFSSLTCGGALEFFSFQSAEEENVSGSCGC